MTDVTSRLPAPLSARVASASSAQTAQGGRAIDYAISGIPFLSAASRSGIQFEFGTAEMQKEQFDSEQEPGEQSLSGWWLRSQDSWHEGAGAKFQESRTDANPSARFFDSSGVDIWTENEIKLLKKPQQASAANTEARCLFVSGENLFLGVGAAVYKTTVGSAPGAALHTAPGETITDVTAGQVNWHAISQEGNVHTGLVAGGGIKSYPLTSADPVSTVAPQLAWAKHRLFATFGRHVYVVNTTDPTSTAQAAKYSYPTTDWTYTSIAEGPACVYLGGYSDAESSIQIITLENDGDIPVLTGGITTAVMPPGERVQRIATLAGTWICIVTSRGVRLGNLGDGGQIQYGPLLLEPEGVVEGAAVTAWDRWFYVSLRTSTGDAASYRIDASTGFEDGSFAYARDMEWTADGYFGDLAVYQGRVVGAFMGGTYPSEAPAKYVYHNSTQLVEQGWIQFGKIRYRTTEPKVFKYVALEVEPLSGSIAVDVVLPNESLNRIGLYNQEGTAELPQSTIPPEIGPQRSVGLKFILTRSTGSNSSGPVIHSYSVKALPAVKPQRLIRLPLMCYDRETWHTGQEWGYDGFGRERHAALMEIEDSGDLVLWQEFTGGEAIGRLVKIESVRFVQASPPDPTRRGTAKFGGMVDLVLRTVD